MSINKKILGQGMIVLGLLGILSEFIASMFITTGCIRGNSSSNLYYLVYLTILLTGIRFQENNFHH